MRIEATRQVFHRQLDKALSDESRQDLINQDLINQESVNQQFVKDGNKTVADILKETDKDLKITKFVRINLG